MVLLADVHNIWSWPHGVSKTYQLYTESWLNLLSSWIYSLKRIHHSRSSEDEKLCKSNNKINFSQKKKLSLPNKIYDCKTFTMPQQTRPDLLILLGTFEYLLVLWDTFGYYWILFDTFGYLWVLLSTFGCFWVLLGTSRYSPLPFETPKIHSFLKVQPSLK